MRFVRPLLLAGVLGFSLAAAAGAGEPSPKPPGWDPALYMGVDELQPGMKGVGRSVFEGDRIEEFQVEILGVLGTASPDGDMILARVSGQGLEGTGIIAGMSGSPVYVDGRLIGALAFGWPFSAEAIGGITPIANMLGLFARSAAPASGGEARAAGFDPARWQSLWEATGETAWDLLVPGVDPGNGLAPLQVPLSVSGFHTGAQGRTAGLLERWGFLPVQGGATGAAASEGDGGELRPGDAIGVDLVRGDARLAAIGTVTWVADGKLLAFGHRMMNLGAAAFPMSRARILTVLPSIASSFKMGTTGEVLGTVTRDYETGIGGAFGPGPRLVPYTVNLDLGERKRDLHFELVDSNVLTPALAGLMAFNSMQELSRLTGPATVRIATRIVLADGRSLRSRSIQAGFSPPMSLAGEIARLVGLVTGNPFEAVSVDSIAVEVAVDESIRAGFLQGIVVPPGPHRPGETVPVTLEIRDYRGSTRTETAPVTIPGNAGAGDMTLTVCDGVQAAKWDRERAPGRYAPRSLDQLIELVETDTPYNRIVLRLWSEGETPVVEGREFPGLPPSLAPALSGRLAGGRSVPTQAAVAYEGFKDLDRVVVGCQSLDINVEPGP